MTLRSIAYATGIAVLMSAAAMAEPVPTTGGTLFFAVDSEPSNYDCQANVSPAFLEAVAPNYSTLLKFDAANYPRIVGDLAESWSVSPDNLTYTFKLRPDVLFHDGAVLTSSDVEITYQRILHPPPGVISARQSNYAAISSIETPDPLTIVFHLQRPDASMLANFASPWNCVYQKAKLDSDPQFPRTHVLGTGPFRFVAHKKGQYWAGRRWDHYYQPNRPYLDGYEADFMSGPNVIKSMRDGQVLGSFRSFTPAERAELETRLGNGITVHESPWLFNLMLAFNTRQPPFDDARIRRALSLAIDRWSMADALSDTTVLKYVGGLMRPGFAMATPAATLTNLPGFSHDIAASREQARQLLAEAGLHNLKITLISQDIPNAYGPRADAIIEAWQAIGVTAHEVRLSARDWHLALESGHFAVALDYAGDAFDDPSLQLAKYVSRSVSPSGYATGASDPELDKLYISQQTNTDPRQRANIVRDFEQRALTEAYAVPILWWNRIVITSAAVKGWNMTPSLYIGQDLADVWIDSQFSKTSVLPPAETSPPASTEPAATPARAAAVASAEPLLSAPVTPMRAEAIAEGGQVQPGRSSSSMIANDPPSGPTDRTPLESHSPAVQ